MPRLDRLLWALLAAASSGCSTKAVVLNHEAVSNLRTAPASRSVQCPSLGEFVDARPDADMGRLGYRDFDFPEFKPWFEAQLRAALPSGDNTDPEQTLRVELLRSYLETNRNTLSFTVVIRATLPGKAPQVLRGAVTKINWWGTQSEFGNYIESASTQVMARLRATCAQ